MRSKRSGYLRLQLSFVIAATISGLTALQYASAHAAGSNAITQDALSWLEGRRHIQAGQAVAGTRNASPFRADNRAGEFVSEEQGATVGSPSFVATTAAHGDFAGQIDVGGRRKLYLQCKGAGHPTVILESGIHDSSDLWSETDTQPPVVPSPAVFPAVAKFTRVCRYARPGTIPLHEPADTHDP